MAVSLHVRADRAIRQRQKTEKALEHRAAEVLDQFKVETKGGWENRMDGVIRTNLVKSKIDGIANQQRSSLQERRAKLAALLSEEQKAYEQEMIDMEEAPAQRFERMASRAYELKKRREDERQAIVKEKLYQQWRAGQDELRTMDSQITQLKVISDRDHQLVEKEHRRVAEKDYDKVFDQLWYEGYLAKIEREELEKELKKERLGEQQRILGIQLDMKAHRVATDKEKGEKEATQMKALWAQQEREEKEALAREKVLARENRKKADEFIAVQQAKRAKEAQDEEDFDKAFVAGVLERERKVAAMEEFEKQKAKKKAIEFTEALKIEMAKNAEDEEELVRLQHEEAERQWAKKYAQWEKEELARRKLMHEVYTDRAQQVQLKKDLRATLKDELKQERKRIDDEVSRLDELAGGREGAESTIAKKHQEELFRQMDYHQVQKHRQLQQHAIEQRQAAIAEEKIRRAVNQEKVKSRQIMKDVLDARHANRAAQPQVTAPWDK
mmetsp:Transcript_9127/g.20320  ORF Transcript_9127/g.20320 Transcript_9127/m.20320 type:complete len:498 (-) Transcript_9127:208-1701(-)|eukprot:CAMPEP_0178409800 /NCGR_PEP_ID=MMETSP0689_2-20121128/20647_1 /TAXON_ID=160604 /ORGANISM="Amphidinium massartii, Strain CS-259" /LENGTH=497 /DNA_ID=CAMNT_0020030949 /DNA_START=120 /DNA_END=1613 /DNA_ORIENTATION=+